MNYFWFFWFCCSLLFLSVDRLCAQTNKASVRLELETRRNSENYHVVPIREAGVMIFYESDEHVNGNSVWDFMLYSTSFKEKWISEFPVHKSMNYQHYHTDSKFLYVLLGNSSDYQLLTINFLSGEIKSKIFKVLGNYTLDYFKVLDNNVFIAGETTPNFLEQCGQSCFSYTCIPQITGATIYKEHIIIQNLNLIDGTNQSIFPSLLGKTSLLGLEENSHFSVDVLVRKISGKRTSETHKISYNDKSEIVSQYELKSDPTKEILNGKLHLLEDHSEIIVGTYANVSLRRRKKLNMSSSNGIYFSKLAKDNSVTIKYYDFFQFSSFSENLKRGLVGGVMGGKKDEGQLGYRLLVHDLLVQNNEYVMCAEAYYPQYRTETYWTTDPQGRAVMRTRQVFEGWRYMHAIICGFDTEGNLLWNNTFEMNEVLSRELKERVKIIAAHDELAMIYSWGGELKTKVINKNEVIEEKSTLRIDTKNSDDEVKTNYRSDIVYWYDGYFISYGYQTLKSDLEKLQGGKKKRTIFYLNKIAYQ